MRSLLLRNDGAFGGEVILPRGKERPTSIIYRYPDHDERYQRDFDDHDNYTLTPEEPC